MTTIETKKFGKDVLTSIDSTQNRLMGHSKFKILAVFRYLAIAVVLVACMPDFNPRSTVKTIKVDEAEVEWYAVSSAYSDGPDGIIVKHDGLVDTVCRAYNVADLALKGDKTILIGFYGAPKSFGLEIIKMPERIAGIKILIDTSFEYHFRNDTNSTKSTLQDPAITENATVLEKDKSERIDTVPAQFDFRKAKQIKVLSLIKRVDSMYIKDREKDCNKWNPTVKGLTSIIRLFEPMTSEGQYMLHSFYPCDATGEIEIDGKVFKFYLDAGSTLTLVKDKQQFHYGCVGGGCVSKFISGRDYMRE